MEAKCLPTTANVGVAVVEPGPNMAVDDAIFALVLHWFADHARGRGEQCTRRAAQKIRMRAAMYGLRYRHNADELGINLLQVPVWPAEACTAAEKRVKDCNAWHLVTVLQDALKGLSVAAVESYVVPPWW